VILGREGMQNNFGIRDVLFYHVCNEKYTNVNNLRTFNNNSKLFTFLPIEYFLLCLHFYWPLIQYIVTLCDQLIFFDVLT
jgi:hypothetical protein